MTEDLLKIAAEHETPMARALRVLLHEHRALGSVLAALQRLTDDVVDRNARPDFTLIASMLHYIDVFPERQHHPKENHHLFQTVRMRSPKSLYVLDRLEGEHARTEWMLLALDRCFVAFQADAASGAVHFRDAVAAYVHFHFAHMNMEENELLPIACQCLTEDDWGRIATAFENNDDPAFGRATQQCFERLRRQIETQAPAKMRRLLRQYGDDAPEPSLCAEPGSQASKN